MKLKLEVFRDISILQASGPITADNLTVLKAGIKKLFKDGKNKIILELPDSGSLPAEVLRELAVLNLLASELAGQIVLSDITPLTRAKIESFSLPPAVRCFADRKAATEYFHPKPVEEAVPPTTAAPSAPATVAAQTFEAAAAPAFEGGGGSKDEIRMREMNDLGELRKRIVELETENKELGRRIGEIVIIRRDPPDLDAWKEKVAKLEKDLSDALQAGQAGAKK